MRVSHWTIENGSGMHRVAESIKNAEIALGLDSIIANPTDPATWEAAETADVQVIHTHFPNEMATRVTRPLKTVYVAHGTPDHVFQSSVEAGANWSYGFSNSLMMLMHWLKRADARVTFWPRHQWIYQGMVDKGTAVHLVPLGVDTAFWSAGESRGKYQGSPSVFTAENCHLIKWPFDLFTAWPTIAQALPSACLHAIYLPKDLHWWFAPWVYATGAGYNSHISPAMFPHDELRNVFKSVDFVCGLVRNGDFNQLSLQANAAGCKTISYAGNEYADYWIREGDQRGIARDLTAILKGDVPARVKTPVPDIADTALGMKAIYETLVETRQIVVPAALGLVA